MIKNILSSNENVTAAEREMAILKENFPSCFRKDGSFDFERFKEYLSDKITVNHEGYELKFLGKNYARLLASLDTTTVVVPDEVHNSKPENANSQNIYISGDNLDGLKHLLKSYAHSIKCIYIDPPYNTGSDGFVYNDSFNFTADELSAKLSIDLEQAKRILDLTKRGSASHSAWLMVMYPRLLLARDLLSEDGVIFISIDDNEQANLKLLCDDVFGEDNLVAEIPWQSRASIQNDTDFSVNHEYILVYAKNRRQENRRLTESNYSEWYRRDSFVCRPLPLDKEKFDNPDNDPRGLWKADPFDAPHIRMNLTYPITNPNTGEQHLPPSGRCWRISPEKFASALKDNRIVWTNNGLGRPQLKVFYEEKKEFGSIDNSWFSAERIGTSTNGTKELMRLFDGKSYFDTPKPTSLLIKLITLANTRENDIILDFFSGSATTAHAVMQLNAEDGGKREFIMVQLPEACNEKSEAYKAGYKTIDKIGMERIIRAAKKIKTEHPETTADLGFKHYILKEPSLDTLDKLEKFDPDRLDAAENNFLQEFGLPTVLATWLVRDGYGLTSDCEEIDLAGYKAYWKDKHLYLIESNLTENAVTALVDKLIVDGSFNPENVVLFGYSFSWTQREELRANLMRLKDTEKNLRINFDVRY